MSFSRVVGSPRSSVCLSSEEAANLTREEKRRSWYLDPPPARPLTPELPKVIYVPLPPPLFSPAPTPTSFYSWRDGVQVDTSVTQTTTTPTTTSTVSTVSTGAKKPGFWRRLMQRLGCVTRA